MQYRIHSAIACTARVERMALDVSWTKWLSVNNEVRRLFTYSDSSDGYRSTIEFICSCERGKVGVLRFYNFIVAPGVVATEGYIIGLLEADDGTETTGFIPLRAKPADEETLARFRAKPVERATLVNVPDRHNCDRLGALLLTGKDLTLSLFSTPKQIILKLPLPNDSEFKASYSATLDRVRES